jgi:ketosteroid isomerase-like protein
VAPSHVGLLSWPRYWHEGVREGSTTSGHDRGAISEPVRPWGRDQRFDRGTPVSLVRPVSETNEQLARRVFEAIGRGDYDLLESLLDPDVKWHAGDPTAEGTCQNRNQALQFLQRGRGPLPDLVDVREVGDKIALLLRPRGTDSEKDAPLIANVTTLRDGKVVEMVHYDRAADALAALGLS